MALPAISLPPTSSSFRSCADETHEFVDGIINVQTRFEQVGGKKERANGWITGSSLASTVPSPCSCSMTDKREGEILKFRGNIPNYECKKSLSALFPVRIVFGCKYFHGNDVIIGGSCGPESFPKEVDNFKSNSSQQTIAFEIRHF